MFAENSFKLYESYISEVRKPISLLRGREEEMGKQNSSKIYKIERYSKINKYHKNEVSGLHNKIT